MNKKLFYILLCLPIWSFAFTVGDTVWNDVNQDWEQNIDEQGYANVTVELYTEARVKLKTTQTDVNGKYRFTNVSEGDYYVEIVLPNGVNTVTDNGIDFWVDQDRLDINFGITSDTVTIPTINNKISGVVWNDYNKNKEFDNREHTLNAITVELYNLWGRKLQTTFTNEDGQYEFNNLDSDDYVVSVVVSNGMELVTLNNLEYWVDRNITDINFGLYKQTKGVTINEVLAANASSNLDPDYKQFSDWIELYNNEDYEIDISDYTLSDDANDLEKWYIPKGTKIPSHGYLVIWADGEYDNQLALHSNFKLSQKGESLFFSNDSGTIVDSIKFSKQEGDISCAKVNNKIVYMNPTPNAENSVIHTSSKRSKKPKFLIKSGFYNRVQTLRLSQVNGGTMYYTTDGSIPTESSTKYTQAIQVNKTMVVRAMALENGKFSSSIENKTYFMNENITLPVVSIAINEEYLNDDNIGIYKNYNERWMRSGSIEYFKDGKSKFSENIGVRIFGGQTRQYAQKSLAIFAKKKYGAKSIKYALFPDKPTIKKVKSFVLRNSGNDWGHTMMKDGLVHSIVKGQMDIDYQSYHPSVVFLNGKYWGIHNIREKTNEDYLEANHGVDSKKVDLLAAQYEVSEGSNQDYKTLLFYIKNNSLADNAKYNLVASKMDIDEYINYMIVEIYGGNIDWPYSNIKYWKEQSANGKWRWILYDTDRTFENIDEDTFNLLLDPVGAEEPNPPWSTFLFRNLMKNDGFKTKFLNTFKVHLDTTFSPARIDAIIVEMKNRLKPEIQRHFTKWPKISPTDWENGNYDSVAGLQEFALGRSAAIKRLMLNYFNVN